MSKPKEERKRVQCPSCGHKAKRVSTLTIGALVDDEFVKQFTLNNRPCCDSESEGCTSVKDDTGWRFCPSRDCDVVYFSEEGDTQFLKSQLTVPVGVKESSGLRPLCYCFGHSVGSIKEELRTKGHSDALEDIRAKMKAPGCHCETSNPSGSCCVGSVTKGIQIAQEEMRLNDSNVTTASSTAEKAAKIGTIVSAIMASACCWLPLLLLAVGVSGAGVAATLEIYRPLFMVVTFGLLGAAFYFTYRPKQSTTRAGVDCCSTESTGADDCCAPTDKRCFSMMALNKVMLWVVTVLAGVFLFFPSYVGVFLKTSNDATPSENMNQAVFKIEGMTCEGCTVIVTRAVKTVPGVLAVEVNYEKGEAIVGTEICCPIPTHELLAAIGSAGYTAVLRDDSTK